MSGITYGLADSGTDAEHYYRNVAAFTNKLSVYSEELLGPLMERFQRYNTEKGEEPRDKGEYVLELLILGTFWRIYSVPADSTSQLRRILLGALANLRGRNNYFKPSADYWRGRLLTHCLATKSFLSGGSAEWPAPTMGNLKKLLHWLKATGEFSQEAKQLHSWLNYFKGQKPAAVSEAINQAIELAAWFEKKSETALGQYTRNVEGFLAEKHPRRRFREDFLFCGRRRVEYHLNMVGAEILNRAFRAEFLAKKRHALVLPSCMRNHNGKECRAYQGRLGLECQGCSPNCRVNKLTRLGTENHFEVYVILHESSMFAEGVAQPEIKGNLGIIGVACVLNLLTGGWKVKEMAIPPQCVLLNCCGCQKHWLDQDVAADIDVNQLMKVLDNGSYRSKYDA